MMNVKFVTQSMKKKIQYSGNSIDVGSERKSEDMGLS